MSDLPNISKVPETASSEELRPLFLKVLVAEATVKDKAELLCELADKQWHCYERMSLVLAQQIAEWIRTAWNPKDFDLSEKFVSIIGHLGLDDCVPLLLIGANDPALPQSSRNEFREALEEFGPTPLDPYLGMSKNE